MKREHFFRERLRAIRKVRGLTGKGLAILMNVPPSTISHFESGRRSPSFKNLLRLSDALVINIDYLVARTDNQHCAGKMWQKLYATLQNISLEDLEVLANFSEKLVEINLQKKSCHINK